MDNITAINLGACQLQYLSIGYVGETGARPVAFDFSTWAAEYGAGVLQLLLQRPGDAEPYPVLLDIDGTTATWTPNDTDTEKKGQGQAQLVYTVGGVIVKNAIFRVLIAPSLGAAGDPPEPYETWLERLTELAAETQQSALDAAESAELAQHSAEDAADSDASAAQSARDAEQDAERAETAAEEAEEAREHIADGVAELNARVTSFEENLVLVQDEQPTEEDNRLWVDTDAGGEITVALYEDYLALEADVQSFEENVVAVQETEPTSEDNRLWIQTGSGEEIQIPTYTEFQAAAGQIDGLANTVDDLSGDVETLGGDLSTLSGAVDTLSGTVSDLSGEVDGLSDDVSDLQAAQPKTVTVTGTTPVIAAVDNTRYVCGEVSTLDITLPTSGCIDVVFDSGTTATVLTVTPPTGVTVRWANGFDPTALEANTIYEINICDGLGVAASWAV